MQLNRQKGMALAPILIALLALSAGAMLWVGDLGQQSQVDLLEQQNRGLSDLNAAVSGFALVNGRLPCPDTNNNGSENCSNAQAAGFVPYRTLGLTAKLSGNIAYTPYNSSQTAGLTTVADVKDITVPDDLPGTVDLSAYNSPSVTTPTVPANNNDAANNVKWLFKKEGYQVNTLTNTAVDVNDAAVVNGINSSYMNALNTYLQKSIPVANTALSFSSSGPTSEYKKLDDLNTNFDELIFNYDAREGLFDMPSRIDALEDNLKEVALANANGSAVTGSCSTMACLQSSWQGLQSEFNTKVSSYNSDTRSHTNLVADSATVTTADNVSLTSALSGLGTSVQDAQNILGDSSAGNASNSLTLVVENNNIYGDDDSYDGDGALTQVVPDIVSHHKKLSNDANTKKAALQSQIDTENAKDDPNQGTIDTLTAERNEYEKLRVHYQNLSVLMQKLFDDLTKRSIIDAFDDELVFDSNATAPTPQQSCDGLVQQYGSAVDMAQCLRVAKGEPNSGDPQTMGAYIDQLSNASATLPTTPTASTSTPSYPVQTNMADLCHKLTSVAADNASQVKVSTTSLAYVLVHGGANNRIDTANVAAQNNGVYAAPDRATSLQYNDQVAAVSAAEMSTMLGCSALLNSYVTFEANINQAQLLYNNADSALGDAEQAVVTGTIDLVLAGATLAVDIGAIVQESAAGAVATATCIASLGFAVNACIAAGIEFAAAAAHGITVVTDGVNVGIATANLVDAVSSRDSAATTKNSTATHLVTTVNQAVAADTLGGVSAWQ